MLMSNSCDYKVDYYQNAKIDFYWNETINLTDNVWISEMIFRKQTE